MLFYYVITNRIYLIHGSLLYSASEHIKLLKVTIPTRETFPLHSCTDRDLKYTKKVL